MNPFLPHKGREKNRRKMNREIKFRAWNKEDKFMSAVLGIDWDEGLLHFKANIGGSEDHWNITGFDVMQFTGVKIATKRKGFNAQGDYNEYLELFEGDIVELKADPKFYVGSYFTIGMRFVCKYLNNAFVFLPCIHFEEYLKHGSTSVSIQGTHPLNSSQTYQISNHFEIIGNIYETPSLLSQLK